MRPTWRAKYGCEVGGCGKVRLPGRVRCADHPADPEPADPTLSTAARVWAETQAKRRAERQARGLDLEQPHCDECGHRRIFHTRLLPPRPPIPRVHTVETMVPCGVYDCRCHEYAPSRVRMIGAR